MGTGITLRWQLAPFACEFHLDGGQGLLLLRAGAEIIARETVASARMAYERAADLVEALEPPRRAPLPVRPAPAASDARAPLFQSHASRFADRAPLPVLRSVARSTAFRNG